MNAFLDAPAVQHLMLAPVLLPLLAAATMMLLNEEQHRLKMALNVGTCAVLLGISCVLLYSSGAGAGVLGAGGSPHALPSASPSARSIDLASCPVVWSRRLVEDIDADPKKERP